MNILDLLFPKYCINCKKLGDYLCANCFPLLSFDTKNICLVCGKSSYNGLTHPGCHEKYSIDGSFTALVFNSISKKLIYQFKYEPYLSSLKVLLGNLFYESLIQYEELNKIIEEYGKDLILVPVPLSSKKFRKRGYNQAELLAKELGIKFDLKIENALIRTRDTKSQVNLNKKERQKNIKDAFALNSKHSAKFQNSKVILVDDVLTSGSTFSEAACVLKRSGVRQVWAVALAKED